MKKLPIIAMTMLIALLAVPASAGDYRDRHHRHYDRYDSHRDYHRRQAHHHRQHYHHHQHNSHRRHDRNAEYLIGGIVLGAVLNELADNHARTTTTRSTTVYSSPGTRVSSSSRYVGNEYLRASDGRCYAVDYRNGDRILTEVRSDACAF